MTDKKYCVWHTHKGQNLSTLESPGDIIRHEVIQIIMVVLKR